MAKTTAEKIMEIEKEIEQRTNRKKQLLQQQKTEERKARTHRLCKRGGMWESMLPDTVNLTDGQFKIFLEKTVMTEYARRILAGLAAQNGESPAETQGSTVRQGNETVAPKPAGAAQNSGINESGNEGNGAGERG